MNTHLDLGEALGMESIADAYGNGPEAHGSAWKTEAGRKALETKLEDLGFLPKGKDRGKWMKKPFRVELGEDGGTVFAYITDDN